jgi:hypothetical protein
VAQKILDEEELQWWIKKWNAEIYRNTKKNDKRSCDLYCGHEWIVVIPNPDKNNEKDSLVSCADSVMEAAAKLQEILFCSYNSEMIFHSGVIDYRSVLTKHECDGIYCGSREVRNACDIEFGKEDDV